MRSRRRGSIGGDDWVVTRAAQNFDAEASNGKFVFHEQDLNLRRHLHILCGYTGY